jgi:antitoxin component HigA of HigAB toxin-antitoxin module
MSEIERLRVWMEKHGFTVWDVSREIGGSRVWVYRMMNSNRAHLSDGFKLRFINRFGIAAATEVFDLTPGNGAPTPTLAPVAELVTK